MFLLVESASAPGGALASNDEDEDSDEDEESDEGALILGFDGAAIFFEFEEVWGTPLVAEGSSGRGVGRGRGRGFWGTAALADGGLSSSSDDSTRPTAFEDSRELSDDAVCNLLAPLEDDASNERGGSAE